MVFLNDLVYSILHNDTKFVKMSIQDGPQAHKSNKVFYFVEEDFFKAHKLSSSIIFAAHVGVLYTWATMFQQQVPYYTIIWAGLLQLYSFMSLTAGVHMLWSHRSYQASWPLKVFFMVGHALCAQYTIETWAGEHRCHHKWSESDCDPHNPRRGSFFAHVGFAIHARHPAALEKSKSLNYDDLKQDPVVKFYTDYCLPTYILVGMLLPTAVPVLFWNESIFTAIMLAYFGRSVLIFHCTMLINSAAHVFGDKNYSARIGATDNAWVSAITLGSGQHNFHHTFPQDYRSSELTSDYNPTRHFIELMAHLGLAHSLKWTNGMTIEAAKAKALANKSTMLHGHLHNYPATYMVKWAVDDDTSTGL
ncbi:Delta(9)-fatty-acid desaturase fat-6 [Halotydeus destructor]|nr:Delta(9)-fatty-acid desaturase fat-6 [Halotydeus destructor]